VTFGQLVLAPLLLWQGRRVRRQALRLPEARGPRSGSVGQGPVRLRLLIVGDSSGAGVGVDTQAQALSGQLAQALAQRLGGQVQWQLLARSGQTSAAALSQLQASAILPADVAVTALGVNDVSAGVAPRRWLAQQAQLHALLSQRAGVRYTVHSAVPPLHRFAMLPQPLRWWMGARARRLNAALARALAHPEQAGQRGLLTPPGDWQQPVQVSGAGLLAEDGFHPSASGYALWAQALAEHIATWLERPGAQPRT
jgi:lysophospholipase L1-like esterase